MSQSSIVIQDAPGATVRASINAALQAITECQSGATAPATTYPNMFWFDTSTGLLKRRTNANDAWITVGLEAADTDGALSANSDSKIATQKATKTYADTKIPLTYLDTDATLAANSDAKIATQKATKAYVNNTLFNKLSSVILEAPNGVAVIDPANPKKIIVKSGLRVLIADGRNDDKSLKSIDLTLASDVSSPQFSSAVNRIYGILFDGEHLTHGYSDCIEQEATPNASTFTAYLWYKPSENKTYYSDGANWIERGVIVLGAYTTDSSGVVTSLTTFTNGYTDRILTSRTPHIVESWKSGSSWYRKYSDGWIEQGGAASGGSVENVTITFQKPFSSTPLFANISFNTELNTWEKWFSSHMPFNRTSTTMQYRRDSMSIIWIAIGY